MKIGSGFGWLGALIVYWRRRDTEPGQAPG